MLNALPASLSGPRRDERLLCRGRSPLSLYAFATMRSIHVPAQRAFSRAKWLHFHSRYVVVRSAESADSPVLQSCALSGVVRKDVINQKEGRYLKKHTSDERKDSTIRTYVSSNAKRDVKQRMRQLKLRTVSDYMRHRLLNAEDCKGGRQR